MAGRSNVIYFRGKPASRALRRPRILMQAAQAGQQGWRRARDLRRLLRCEALPTPERALAALHEQEARMNEARLSDGADYDVRRHVMLAIAILAETRLLGARDLPDAPIARAAATPARP